MLSGPVTLPDKEEACTLANVREKHPGGLGARTEDDKEEDDDDAF